MKSFWIRLVLVVGVLVVIVAGAATLATPDLIKKDTTKCGNLQRYCTISCADSVYTHGACRDDKTGVISAISVECCCCTEGANHRSFIGG